MTTVRRGAEAVADDVKFSDGAERDAAGGLGISESADKGAAKGADGGEGKGAAEVAVAGAGRDVGSLEISEDAEADAGGLEFSERAGRDE